MIWINGHVCKSNIISDPYILGYAHLILDGVVGTI